MQGRRWLGFALACLMYWTGSTQVLAGTISSESAKQEAAGNISAGYAAASCEDESYIADSDTGAVSEGVFFKEVDVSSMVYQAGGLGTPVREDDGIAAYAISAADQLKSAILAALQAGEASLDVTAYGLTTDDFDEINILFAEVLNENAELFYVWSALGWQYTFDGVITKLWFTYDEVTEEQKKALADKLAEATSLVNDTMSDAEKALVLHDYLAQHCVYAYKEYTENTLSSCPNVYDVYGALVRQKAVCQGYAQAYLALLQKVGITSYICSSKEMNHAWNVVLIDGSWYHVDVTWDDPVWNREGRAKHTYFLLSDVEMGNRKHYGWADNVECTSDKYDAVDYWWTKANSQIVRLGAQDYVYVKDLGGTFQLVRRTNETEKVIYSSDLHWNVWGEPNSWWGSAYAYLSRQENNIYFNDRAKVYSLSLDELADASPKVEYTYDKNDGYIYGAMVYEDGKIRLNICQDPNEEGDNIEAGEVEGLTRVFPFADVAQDAWYYNAIEAVYNKGYMSGKGDGSFSPAGLLTRGEIATVLYNMSERPDTAYEEHFGDIPSGQWYSAPVTWVYQNNIAAGYGNGDFGVADRLTREQLAVMLYQYARHQNNNLAYDDNALTSFPDAGQVSSWAETAMKWAVSKQIINGTGDGYLKPDGNATRAECASVINGYAEKVQ